MGNHDGGSVSSEENGDAQVSAGAHAATGLGVIFAQAHSGEVVVAPTDGGMVGLNRSLVIGAHFLRRIQ